KSEDCTILSGMLQSSRRSDLASPRPRRATCPRLLANTGQAARRARPRSVRLAGRRTSEHGQVRISALKEERDMSVEGYALVADERYSARSQGADAILHAATAAELLEAIKGE